MLQIKQGASLLTKMNDKGTVFHDESESNLISIAGNSGWATLEQQATKSNVGLY